VQTAFSGLANNDAGDFKKRVDESLQKLTPPTLAADPNPTASGDEFFVCNILALT
jgi:hypothetical protein